MKVQRKSGGGCGRIIRSLRYRSVQDNIANLIGSNSTGDEGAKEIGIALNKNYTLTTLDLGIKYYYQNSIGKNIIGNEGAKGIGFGLQRNKTLTTLYLGILHYCYFLQKAMGLEMKEQRKSDLHYTKIKH
eukprot:TRINITY_DN659_c0_g1_i10.p3 TRINITY_DN659_c0_g1~~TRINITY_DN659_c0_g1_i10.p3  ORF type:complete len:130 (-),score=2.57 TRINITY_DN659_c0_g1_i10:542-931(-)